MAAQAQALPRPSVLFVDDEPRVLNSMRAMFRREYETHFASSGREAIGILEEEDIDVIVADHRMPQMSGVEVLTQAKTLSPRSVRILLTGYADQDAVESSINDGEVFRFLTKPCEPDKLRETLQLAARLAIEPPSPEATPVSEPSPAELAEAHAVERTLGNDEFLAALRARREANRSGLAGETPQRKPPRQVSIEARKPTAPARPAPQPVRNLHKGFGILVFSSDEHIHHAAKAATKGRLPVYRASNIVQVVKILNEHAPGVLLTDISEDKNTIQTMTARLKEHLPELVTIAVSEHRDVLDMVWLINHGQIFRFLRKPLSPGRCAVSFKAALLHHHNLLKHPELVKRHTVDSAPQEASAMSKLSRLSFLRKLWGAA